MVQHISYTDTYRSYSACTSCWHPPEDPIELGEGEVVLPPPPHPSDARKFANFRTPLCRRNPWSLRLEKPGGLRLPSADGVVFTLRLTKMEVEKIMFQKEPGIPRCHAIHFVCESECVVFFFSEGWDLVPTTHCSYRQVRGPCI